MWESISDCHTFSITSGHLAGDVSVLKSGIMSLKLRIVLGPPNLIVFYPTLYNFNCIVGLAAGLFFGLEHRAIRFGRATKFSLCYVKWRLSAVGEK